VNSANRNFHGVSAPCFVGKMKKFILGKKLGMSQMFDEKGNRVSLTLVEAGPCQILQIKNKTKDGYSALQLGFLTKEKNIKKTEKGKEFKYVKEQRLEEDAQDQYKIGGQIDVSVFQEGDIVKVSGVSKGKGFQGVVKKWGFHGRASTHGTKHEVRTPGSVGMSGLGRVIKGKKLAGRMGAERVTVSNVKIVKIDKENNVIALNGAVPGPNGVLIEIAG
jgi:large subunit ribosomal protein L3